MPQRVSSELTGKCPLDAQAKGQLATLCAVKH